MYNLIYVFGSNKHFLTPDSCFLQLVNAYDEEIAEAQRLDDIERKRVNRDRKRVNRAGLSKTMKSRIRREESQKRKQKGSYHGLGPVKPPEVDAETTSRESPSKRLERREIDRVCHLTYRLSMSAEKKARTHQR